MLSKNPCGLIEREGVSACLRWGKKPIVVDYFCFVYTGSVSEIISATQVCHCSSNTSELVHQRLLSGFPSVCHRVFLGRLEKSLSMCVVWSSGILFLIALWFEHRRPDIL